MTVTSDHAVALRAFLTGDLETFRRFAGSAGFLDGQGFSILVLNAFYTAAQRRFRPGWTRGDLIRFVGHVRARNGGAAGDLSATAAEQMLFRALTGEPMTREFDEFTKGMTQIGLLVELLSELNEQDLDEFLVGARQRADAWLARHNVR